MWPIDVKVISGFQVLRQVRAPVAGDRTCDRGVPTNLRADSLSTVPPTPQSFNDTHLIILDNGFPTKKQSPKSTQKSRGVGGTVDSESALRSAGTILSRVQAPSPSPWPERGPET
ncbi:hypothetical protein PoB_003261000 [Plakobranchus ocellatus]|uniref:Uncharacterized protein n=1 Tax=Plakobranchus ocellatus TaxID=259542 RepID=A0AAV4AH56_9GAST|nr:hypothetical protein PoB_003261000 [Plakobranchus ocellatus]